MLHPGAVVYALQWTICKGLGSQAGKNFWSRWLDSVRIRLHQVPRVPISRSIPTFSTQLLSSQPSGSNKHSGWVFLKAIQCHWLFFQALFAPRVTLCYGHGRIQDLQEEIDGAQFLMVNQCMLFRYSYIVTTHPATRQKSGISIILFCSCRPGCLINISTASTTSIFSQRQISLNLLRCSVELSIN